MSRVSPPVESHTIVLADLRRNLERVAACFDVATLLGSQRTEEAVEEYYKQSVLGYQLFHSADGVVHMALNSDGVFDTAGFEEQARFVSEVVDASGSTDVLELGCGPGFNVRYLARSHPGIAIQGIDLSEHHIKLAMDDGRELQNARFLRASFQDLPFRDNSFDLVYAIESVCHATDMRAALSEAFRVLRPNGRLVVFDGFRGEHGSGNSVPEREALLSAGMLVEASMTIHEGWRLTPWIELAREVGFAPASHEDLSHEIMPSLLRLNRIARMYFSTRWLCRNLRNVMPRQLTKNAIAGLLMPYTVKYGSQRYVRVVLVRPNG